MPRRISPPAARRRRASAQPGDRPDRLPDRGRPVRDPGDPAVAGPRLRRHAGRDGPCRQRQHDRHGGGGAGGRLLQPPHRPPRAASSSAWPCSPIPTALLATAPDLATFTALRVAQGVFMSAAFTLTLAYLGERCSAADAAGALAAYVTGNVASNLFGRLLSAAVADHLGLAANFYVFALLNLGGAVLVWFWLGRTPSMMAHEREPGLAVRDLGRASAQRAAAARLRHRLPASCSPSSAPSPTSTSCWPASRWR